MKAVKISIKNTWGSITTYSDDWTSSWGGNEMYHSGGSHTEDIITKKDIVLSWVKPNSEFIGELKNKFMEIMALMGVNSPFSHLYGSVPREARVHTNELFETDNEKESVVCELPKEFWENCPEIMIEIHQGIKGWYLTSQIEPCFVIIKPLTDGKFAKYGFDVRSITFPRVENRISDKILGIIETALLPVLGVTSQDSRYSYRNSESDLVFETKSKSDETFTGNFSLEDLKAKFTR